jgi:outer membrane protein assembly factor BamB
MRRLGIALFIALSVGACSSSKPPLPTLAPIANSSDLRLAWRISLPKAGVGFAPIVQGDAVLAAAGDGTVVKVNGADGRVLWRKQLGVPLSAGVGADAEIAVVVDRSGEVIALDAQGQQRWKTSLGTDAASVPAVGLGLVVVRTGDNRVHALDAETGRKKWTFQRQSPVLALRQTAGTAISGGAAFVGLPGGRLAALGLIDGVPRWEQLVSLSRGTNDIERLSDIVGSPLVSGREVCAVAFQGRIACFEASSGNPVWSNEFSSFSGLEIDARLVIAGNANGHVSAFSRDGKLQWKQTALERRVLNAPVSVGQEIMIADHLGVLHFLSREDGALVGRMNTDGSAIVAPAITGRRLVVVQTTDSSLIGLTW